ncbi:MAG: hypothetical protein ACR2RL_02395, partial [Gammaproteobacteria bacterium]
QLLSVRLMSAMTLAGRGFVRAPIARLGIRRLFAEHVGRKTYPDETRQRSRPLTYVREMSAGPLALHTNAQCTRHNKRQVPSSSC